MLRAGVLLLAFALACGGAWLHFVGEKGAGLKLLCAGVVIFAGVLFERWRYRKKDLPGANWQPTGERFADPQSGEVMEVLYDPTSGERRYVRSSDRASRP